MSENKYINVKKSDLVLALAQSFRDGADNAIAQLQKFENALPKVTEVAEKLEQGDVEGFFNGLVDRSKPKEKSRLIKLNGTS